MAEDYANIIARQWERAQSDLAAWNGELEGARRAHDWDRIDRASDEIIELRKKSREISAVANDFAAQQQRAQAYQPSNQFGLSRAQEGVALSSWVDRPDLPRLTNEQKFQMYAANRNRLANMRAAGTYDDTQGRVFKGAY